MIPGRWENVVCVCRCALCVRRVGTRGPFHAPPQLKPRYEVKSGKKGERVHERDTNARCVSKGEGEKRGLGTWYCCMSGEKSGEWT